MPTALFDLDSLAKNLIEKYPKRKGELLLKGPSLKNYNPRYWYEIQQGEIYLLRKEEIKNVK